jgi:hypothetical protein
MFVELYVVFGVTVMRWDVGLNGYLCTVHNPVPPSFWLDLEDYLRAKCYGTEIVPTSRSTTLLSYFVFR